MASIPLPALDIKTQGESPLAQYAQLQQIKSAQQQQKLVSAEAQQRQLQIQDQQATTSAMKEWDGKNPDDLPPLVLKHGGSSTAVFGLKNTIMDWRTKAATLEKDQLANLDKTNEIIAGHFEAVKGADDKQAAYTAATQDLQQKGLAKPGQFPDQYPGDDWLDMQEKQHMGQKAIVEQAQKDKEVKAKQLEAETTAAKEKREEEEFRAKLPGGVLEEPDRAKMRDWLAKNPGKGPSDYEIAMKKIVPAFNFNLQNQTGVGGAPADVAKRFGMTPEAFDQAAEKYYSAGTLPPGTRGQGIALQRAIMNRTAELHKGESLTEGSAEYKANAESLKKLQSSFDMVSAFEKTAVKNLDMFNDLAKKVTDSGIPILNAPLRSAASLLGSKDQAAFDAARQVAVNEIAKVTSSPGLSGVLSDSARKEVESFIPEKATVGQIVKLSETLKKDMANRHDSYDAQIQDIKQRMGGKAGGGSAKTLTSAQIAQAAKDHNVSVEEAARQAKAAGYEVKD